MNNIITLQGSWIDTETNTRKFAAVNTTMDPDLITNSRSFDEALAHFVASGAELPVDLEFDYFEINKQRYTWDEIFLTWNVESSLQTRVDREASRD